MKKLIVTAVAVAASASIVCAATTAASNIVGYSAKSLSGGQFLMLAPQFAGDAAGMTLGEAFSGQTDLSVVFTWNGASYTKYTYFAAAPGWFDDIFTPSDGVVIEAGDAVWLSGGAADVTILGEVTTSDSVTNSLVAGFNMIANPYPVALTLGEVSGAALNDLDVIFTWNGSSYSKYTYFAAAPGWFDDIFTPSDSVAVPVGDGFWFSSASGGDLILNKLY